MTAPEALTGRVATIIRLRVRCDGPGVRSVVFLYGCPLQCRWCCNPETRSGDGWQSVTPARLWDLVRRDWIYFQESGGGITFSGGEPLAQYAFIREFARLTKGLVPIHLETSLYAPREAVEALIPHIGHWLVDFKAPDEARHREFTGVSQAPVLENLALLASCLPPEKITLSCPLIPGYTATEEYIDALIARMGELGLTRAELHPHRKSCEKKYTSLSLALPDIPALPREDLDRLRLRLEKAGICTDHLVPVLERDKCPVLKEIRRTVAARHGIPLKIPECTYRGRCPGTCPRCEAELDTINRWLQDHPNAQNPTL